MLLAFLRSGPPFPFAGEVAAALSALLWASAGIVFARLRPTPSPGAINFGKNASSVLCFAVLLCFTVGAPWPAFLPGSALPWFVLSGVIGLTICDTLLLRSLQAIGPQRMSLIFTIAPIVVALVALAPPYSETPSVWGWIGMLVCISGIALAVLERPMRDRAHDARFKRGVRDAVLAAICQAIAVLLARYGIREADVRAEDGALVRLAAGTAGLVVIGLPAGRLIAWQRQLRNPRVFWPIFVAAFFGTFIGIWTNQLSLEWAEHTGIATVLNSLMPIYLIPLSAIFLGERHTARGWTATILAIAGIALMTVLR